MANVYGPDGKLIGCGTGPDIKFSQHSGPSHIVGHNCMKAEDEIYLLKKANEILEATLLSVSKDRNRYANALKRLVKHVGPGWRKVAREAVKEKTHGQ